MKPISVDFSGVSDQGGFYIAPGTYKAVIKKVEQDRKPGGDFDYLEWTFDLPENGHVTLTDKTSLSPKAVFHLYNLLEAVTGKKLSKTALTFDPDKIVGKPVIVRVADRPYNGKMYSDITAYMPITASPPRSVTPPAAPVTAAPVDDDEDLPF